MSHYRSRILRAAVALLCAALSPRTFGACPDFLVAPSYAVGTAPRAVAVGDFNGDGKNDLAVANDISNNVSILLNNGGGTFTGPVNYPANSPFSVSVGDFNRDGKKDLVVANSGAANVSILLGKGDGTFAAPVN